MTNTTFVAPVDLRPPAKPQSIAQARAEIDVVIATQPLSKASGYVKVNDDYYHVTKTSAGPIVSLLEWKKQSGEDAGYARVHNLFAVDINARDKAVHAWINRQPDAEEKNDIPPSEEGGLTRQSPPSALPMKSARSGAR